MRLASEAHSSLLAYYWVTKRAAAIAHDLIGQTRLAVSEREFLGSAQRAGCVRGRVLSLRSPQRSFAVVAGEVRPWRTQLRRRSYPWRRPFPTLPRVVAHHDQCQAREYKAYSTTTTHSRALPTALAPVSAPARSRFQCAMYSLRKYHTDRLERTA